MDIDLIEQAIDEELEQLSVNLSDIASENDTDMDEDFTEFCEKLENDFPDSLHAFLEASSNSMRSLERLSYDDLNIKDLKYDKYNELERQISLEWKELEERIMEEDEEKKTELELKFQLELDSAGEEGEYWRRSYEHFEEELRKIQAATPLEHQHPSNEERHLELMKHQEVIKELEKQIDEEWRLFEEAQKEEKRRTEERRSKAATTLQAAFRGLLVHRHVKNNLLKKREQEMSMEKERIEVECLRMQYEEEQHSDDVREREHMMEEQEEEVKRVEEKRKRRCKEEKRKIKDMERIEKENWRVQEEERRDAKRKWEAEMKRKVEKRKKRELRRKSETENGNLESACKKEHPGQLNLSEVFKTHSHDNIKATSLKSKNEARGRQCVPADSAENIFQDSKCEDLPESARHKRLAWLRSCTSWSVLSVQNKKRGLSASKHKPVSCAVTVPFLPPLPVEVILYSGTWSTLKQVTTLTLEDLSDCSLSTLSECTGLRSLTLRRCGLQALDGLNQCSKLSYIDVQENNIACVDCGGLSRLRVLLLGRNKLTNIHGLDDAVSMTVLQLSYNMITYISGLGSVKRLQRLSVDHNNLRCTKGLSEVCTLVYLDCSYNLLNYVEGLENCALLNTLDLRRNGLLQVPQLKNHVLLRELYVDDNVIMSLDDLVCCWLPLLRHLSVSQNSISRLPLLSDLISLKTLDIRHNSLSDPRNIKASLQGCSCLQEFNMTDNPLLFEANWRSSLLSTVPNLVKLNGEKTKMLAKSSLGAQLGGFKILCQAHQDQLDTVLQRHSREISMAASALEAQLTSIKHSSELFRLAKIQRKAHEGGDCVTSEAAALENTHDLSTDHTCVSTHHELHKSVRKPKKTWDGAHLPPDLSAGDCTSSTAKLMQQKAQKIGEKQQKLPEEEVPGHRGHGKNWMIQELRTECLKQVLDNLVTHSMLRTRSLSNEPLFH